LSKNDEGLKDGVKDLQVADGMTPQGQFALALLSKIGKANKLTNAVVLSLSKDCPLKLDFSLAGDNGTENWGAMTFYIAPKIEDEDAMQS
jgi:DNA polymerase III sliding clamp (beta) subunit (PCNA family)